MFPIRSDYLLHFAFSALIVFTLAPFVGLWLAVLICAVIGLYKELVHDYYQGKGRLEMGDFVANTVGLIYATAILYFT
jgi:hypothetical protein